MNKMQIAHEYALEMAKQGIPLKSCKELAWKYADAMQAEADERNKAEAEQKRKEVREILSDANTFIELEGQHFDDVGSLCEVDWSAAPKNAFQWQMIGNEAYWRIEIMGGLDTEPAPSFGFTGSHIVERPQ